MESPVCIFLYARVPWRDGNMSYIFQLLLCEQTIRKSDLFRVSFTDSQLLWHARDKIFSIKVFSDETEEYFSQEYYC